MRKLSIVITSVSAVVFALALGTVLNALYNSPDVEKGKKVRLTVREGESFSSVISRLDSLGLVDHPTILDLYAVFSRRDRLVRAGTYDFSIGERPVGIIDRLVSGDILKVTVTIPEGRNIWEIGGILKSAAGIDSSAFVEFAMNPENAAGMGIKAPSLEGYLFPDTYTFRWGIGFEDIAGLMVGKLKAVIGPEVGSTADSLGLNLNQVLTLASIIEAETRLPEERATVSAVYHNRLKRGMKLEADPTVAYAKGGFRGRLLRADLLIDSPYNTYIHSGLPPGPICSPGKASIDAALHPDPGCKALYFVAKGDGGHIFSLTLKDHLAAIASVKEKRKRRLRKF